MLKPFCVSGNTDQIVKASGIRLYDWRIQHEKIPNRVYCAFESLDDAEVLYNWMRDRKMVAFRNWM